MSSVVLVVAQLTRKLQREMQMTPVVVEYLHQETDKVSVTTCYRFFLIIVQYNRIIK